MNTSIGSSFGAKHGRWRRAMSVFPFVFLTGTAAFGLSLDDVSYSIPLSDEFVCEARISYVGSAGVYSHTVLTSAKYANDKLTEDCKNRRPWKPSSVRWLSVEGVNNVRDCGGWTGLREGMVLRGGEMDSARVSKLLDLNNPNHEIREYGNITKAGLQTAREIVKVKTDLDLRGEAIQIGESALGGDIGHVLAPIGAYERIFDTREPLITCLKTFANSENYPIYVHCAGGADRTGSLLFLIEGLCGVSEEDLSIDYELTTFGLDRRQRTDGPYHFASFVKRVKSFPGANLKDKIERFVREELGLSALEVAVIRKSLSKRPNAR